MKLLSMVSIAMIHAWQPSGEPMQWGQATVDVPSHSDHQGKAYVGKAFLDEAREQAEKEKTAIGRLDVFTRDRILFQFLKKMACTKMIVERLKQYQRIELQFLG